MNQSDDKKIELIKGVFSKMEGKDIIQDLLDYKINYHKRKNFGWEERFGKPNPDSVKRIGELKEAKAKLEAILRENESIFDKIKVSSLVEISFVKEKELA
ncbi:MAG: hypothetical protein R2769_14095 [Saprospiraceae bacterium]